MKQATSSWKPINLLLELFLYAIILSSSLFPFQHKVQGSLKTESIVRTKRVCVTRECSDLSRRILQSLDPEADPCHSFYSFSCGGWMERNQPPPGRMVHSVMSLMRDRVDEKLRGKLLHVSIRYYSNFLDIIDLEEVFFNIYWKKVVMPCQVHTIRPRKRIAWFHFRTFHYQQDKIRFRKARPQVSLQSFHDLDFTQDDY